VPAVPLRRMLRAALPWTPLLVAGGIAAYFQLFTYFVRYDDEGYLLISLSEFLDGGVLYDEVYTQYGPFYYLLFGGFFELLGVSVTANAGRLIVVVVWLATATLHGIAVHRLTGWLWVGVAAQLVAFMTLRVLIAEPMHPIGLTCLLLAGMLALAGRSSGRATGVAVGLGLLVAALVMTKINVGALAAVAVLAAAALALPPLRMRRFLRYGALALLLLAALGVLGPDLGRAWVLEFLAVVAGALAATAITVLSSATAEGGVAAYRWVAIVAGTAVAAALAIALTTVALGSSAGEVIDGVVLEPAKLRDVFVVPVSLPNAAVDWAILAVVAAVAVRTFPRVDDRPPSAWSAAARIVAGFAVWASVTASAPFTVSPPSGRMVIPLLVAWIAAAPPRGVVEAPWAAFARVFVVLLAVLEALQAYPVAGSQLTAAALMFVPVGGLLIADGLRTLVAAGARESVALKRWSTVVGLAIVIGLIAKFAVDGALRPLWVSGHNYSDFESVSLHGTDHIRMPPADAAGYERFATAIRDRCESFISLPGLNSFYLWTGVPPPTGMNAGDWMYLLDTEQQQRVVDAVRGIERLCLVRSDELLAVWGGSSQTDELPNRPLVRFIEETRWREIDSALNGFYKLYVREASRSG
jgi:hypothetical protein